MAFRCRQCAHFRLASSCRCFTTLTRTQTDGFATERGSAHFVDFQHTCGERVALASEIGHITKVDAAYGGNNRASVSLWMRVPLDDTEPTDANPAKGALSDYKCAKCGEKIGELYIRNPDPYDGGDDVRCKLMVLSKSNPEVALLIPVAPEGSSESLEALLAKQTPFTGTLGAPKRSVERRLAYAFLWCARPLSGDSSPNYLASSGVIGLLKVLEQAEVKARDHERIDRLIDAFGAIQQMDVWQNAPITMRQIVCDDLLCRLKAAVEHALLVSVPTNVATIVDECANAGHISVIGYAHALWIEANVKSKNDKRIASVFARAEAVFADSTYDDIDQFLRDYCSITSHNGHQPIVDLATKHAWYPSLIAAYAARRRRLVVKVR